MTLDTKEKQYDLNAFRVRDMKCNDVVLHVFLLYITIQFSRMVILRVTLFSVC